MSLTSLSALLRGRLPYLQKPFTLVCSLSNKAYSTFLNSSASLFTERCSENRLLVPQITFLQPERGLKYMGKVRLRCKDCYFVVRDQRTYVMCKTHPRHKQAAIKKKEKYTWMLSHATQSPIRQW